GGELERVAVQPVDEVGDVGLTGQQHPHHVVALAEEDVDVGAVGRQQLGQVVGQRLQGGEEGLVGGLGLVEHGQAHVVGGGDGVEVGRRGGEGGLEAVEGVQGVGLGVDGIGVQVGQLGAGVDALGDGRAQVLRGLGQLGDDGLDVAGVDGREQRHGGVDEVLDLVGGGGVGDGVTGAQVGAALAAGEVEVHDLRAEHALGLEGGRGVGGNLEAGVDREVDLHLAVDQGPGLDLAHLHPPVVHLRARVHVLAQVGEGGGERIGGGEEVVGPAHGPVHHGQGGD